MIDLKEFYIVSVVHHYTKNHKKVIGQYFTITVLEHFTTLDIYCYKCELNIIKYLYAETRNTANLLVMF